jgi:DNA-binding NarL/FixJ family response regulator
VSTFDRPAVRVAIIDDHPIATESLAVRFVGAGFTVLAPSASVEAFDDSTKPHVVVCDLHLPGMSGGRAVAELAGRGYRVLTTSGGATPDEVLDAVAAGGSGYVDKTAPSQTFVQAVTALVAGTCHVSARLAGYLLDDAGRRPLAREEIGPPERALLRSLAQGDLLEEFATAAGLTSAAARDLLGRIFDAARRRRRLHRPSPREAEVMLLVGCRGMSHKEAARAMNVRVSVVADYLRMVKTKYLASHPDAVESIAPSTAALLWARELGFG